MTGGVAPPEPAASKTWLLDTGPGIADLDSGDLDYDAVAVGIGGFTGRSATTSTVIAEPLHFVATEKGGPRLPAEFSRSTGTQVYDLCRPPEIVEAALLMEKYADTPMDFADARFVSRSRTREPGGSPPQPLFTNFRSTKKVNHSFSPWSPLGACS